MMRRVGQEEVRARDVADVGESRAVSTSPTESAVSAGNARTDSVRSGMQESASLAGADVVERARDTVSRPRRA